MTAKKVSWFFLGLIIVLVIWKAYSINKESYNYSERIMGQPIYAKIDTMVYKGRGGYRYFYKDSFIWGTTLNDGRSQVLSIGDSIIKDANSLKFKVSRKDSNGTYKLVKTIQGKLN